MIARLSSLSLVVLALACAPALAQQRPANPPAAAQSGPVNAPLAGFGANSKDPIKVDADRLDVFDRESRAVFSGNVVAVQGKSTIRCSKMTILYENRNAPAAGGQRATQPQPAAASAGGDGAIRRVECEGPVTVTSDDQTATGRNAVFDRENSKVILTGDVALAKGPNITRGERLVYDTRTGIANIDTRPGGRVQGFFVPGSGDTTPAPGAPQPRRPAGPPTN